MRVLALSSYPVDAAATRFRIWQYKGLLKKEDIAIELSPFLTGSQFQWLYEPRSPLGKLAGIAGSVIRRIAETFTLSRYDLLFIQREAMFFGPAFFEWIYQWLGRMPMVLDLDDATYVKYVSPRFGRLGSFFKFFGKTDRLIDRADLVICGNRYIAEYVEKRGTKPIIIPTIVDTEIFTPVENTDEVPVIGWIGTHSTFPFLERLFPILADLAKKHEFKLKIVGAGKADVRIEGVEVENHSWSLDREVADFQSLDIGLYPLDAIGDLDPAWLAGKSGFKAIQYLAVGIPFVMSPIGVCGEIGEPDKTHFNAETAQDWYNSLDRLLGDPNLRLTMGRAGREHSLATYRLDKHASELSKALAEVWKQPRS